jgi:hypothetical protein
MREESTADTSLSTISTQVSSTAYQRATKLLWFDIIVTFTLLTVVASRL